MNWDNLGINDWIDMEDGFIFYVDSYTEGLRVESKCFTSVIFAKQHMEYIKMHEKDIDTICIIAVKNSDEGRHDFENFDEYWANVDIWIRKEVK